MALVSRELDGYFWRKMPQTQKYGHIVGYETGFRAGVVEAWSAATGEKEIDQWLFSVFTVVAPHEDLTEAVDEFYSDYANRAIYLSFALRIIIGRIEGYISDEQAKERIQTYRRNILKQKEGE